MTIYRKIFLAIFITSTTLLAISAYCFYLFALHTVTTRYVEKYQAVASTMAESISNLERTTEGMMHAALLALKYRTDSQPLPTDAALTAVAQDLAVSSIEFVRPDGQFIRSTSYDLATLPNLFALCADYRGLFTGQRQYDRTPLMPSLVDNRVWKYSLLPSGDRQHVLNVGMEVHFVDDLFRSLFDGDKQLLDIGLFTPTGRSIGNYHRGNSKSSREPLNVGGAFSSHAVSYPDRVEVFERIPAPVNSCCECVVKGLVAAPTASFFYILRIEVSLDELHRNTRTLRLVLGLLLLPVLLLSYLLSGVIARRLSSRIAQINAKTDELVGLKDLSLRINMSGADEISKIGQNFDRLLASLDGAQKDLVAAEKARTLGALASQVAHDIRSPLAALDIAMVSIQADIPEDTRLMLRSAVGRIRDIANDLIQENRRAFNSQVQLAAAPEAPAVHLLSILVEEVVSEKRLQLSSRMGVEVDAPLGKDTYGCFAEVLGSEFKRAISNLIDNAVDALPGAGKVTLRLAREGSQVALTVSDNGKGIPEELLMRLGERGFTHGKVGGSGLGLHQARSTVERWGGSLSIRSAVGAGTTVEVKLPAAAPPSWFAGQIDLRAGQVVLILDDDRAIHATWDQLLTPHVSTSCEVLHFTEAHALRSWLSQNRSRSFLGLIDYELLRQELSGLDVIEQEHIADRAILVTSRFADPAILQRAAKLNLRIIPKGLVGQVPIVVQDIAAEKAAQDPSKGPRVLVIDDDAMISWAWRKQQQRLGLAELVTFPSMEACEAAAPDYSKFDLAFVDLNIDGTEWSLEDTLRHLRQHGVKRIFVATGAPDANLERRCGEADGVTADKIPQDLAPYLAGPSRSAGIDS